MLQNLQPYEGLILLVCAIYFLAILISYLLALRLDKRGIRTYAVIHSIETEEYSTQEIDGYSESSYRRYANIEFDTKDHKRIKLKILADRYTSEKYREKLPIIYLKNRPDKAKINDILYIYQWPLVLILIALIILLITGGFMILGE